MFHAGCMIQRLCSSAVCLVVLPLFSFPFFEGPWPSPSLLPRRSVREACTCQRCLDQAHWASKTLIVTFNGSLPRDPGFFKRQEPEPSLQNSPSSCYLADRYNSCAKSIREKAQICPAGLFMGQMSGLITN